MPHSPPPVRLAAERSSGLLALLYALHGSAAVLALVACGIQAPGLLLVGAIGLHLLQTLDALRRQDAELLAVILDSAGAWRLQWRDGVADSATLLPGPIVASWFSCLRLRSCSGRGVVTLVLMPGNVDAASFRRLRMRLAWARGGAAGASDPAALAPRQP